MTRELNRRVFLRFLGAGLTGTLWQDTLLGPLQLNAAQRAQISSSPFSRFDPIQPTTRDDLVLPDGFVHDVIAVWGDGLTGTNARFGYNADYTAFFPTNTAGTEGLLVVNHESVSLLDVGQIGVYTQSFPYVFGRAPSIADEMHDVGLSILQIRRDANGGWEVLPSPVTRRYDATSRMRPSGPALQKATNVGGTLANCSGCHTPWNTVLTCEENVQDFVPWDVDTAGRGAIGGRFGLDGAHFGWVVEIDPHDPEFVPVKHTQLGRFRHENVAVRAEPGQPLAAYMGDDRSNGHVYKFVSTRTFTPGAPDNRGGLLSSGRLYAAVFNADGTGEWRELAEATPLRPNAGLAIPHVPSSATTLGQVYSDIGAIVTDAYRASNLIGATPTGRPEDVEVHPIDGSIYIAFTDAATSPGSLFHNLYGEIWRIEESTHEPNRFAWTRWKAGGPNEPARAGYVFAAPDNLSFDPNGDLWVVCDVATQRLNADPRFMAFQNNGMFFIPVSGRDAGLPLQFASAPCEAELTGPSWTPDRRTLFLSIQHPGEASGLRQPGMPEPRGSNWPSRRVGASPRPGVVAIRQS